MRLQNVGTCMSCNWKEGLGVLIKYKLTLSVELLYYTF